MSKKTVYITLSKTVATNDRSQVIDKKWSIVYPIGAHHLNVVVEPMQQICNGFIELELELAQLPAACKAGCDVCCNQLIPLSGVEVLYLQKVIEGMPQRTRRRVYAAFESLRKKAQRMLRTSDDQPTTFDQRYFELGVACPFLENGRCGIYSRRPLVCREYNVDSPPYLCKSPYSSPELHRIARGLNLGAMLSAFSARMLGIDNWPVPMFLMAQWGKENPYARLTYDSKKLMESLLNAIKTTVENDAAFSSFSWQYTQTSVANSDDLSTITSIYP
jgi:Fe-S-cluster containining protein